MVWGVWAILHFLVVMNVIKIGGLSQSSAFMGAANVAFLYPQPHEPRSTATFTIAPVTALPTSRVIAATGTVPVSASVTTEGFIASPTSLVAPASTIFSSIIPVDATTVAPIVKKDDATAIASKRQETQPVIAMQTPTNYQPLPSTEEPMLIGLAQFFGCIIHVLASIFAVICALLMPNNTLKLTRAQEVHSEDGL
ncbi:hypothetical protein BJ741DRAFT_610670 [Chytriomyces cf. hyalinus JEL632]|nr:hypothetical protein BJ741DRAFT_610670 [Chytriomyces cf. hyalinus JEL632]